MKYILFTRLGYILRLTWKIWANQNLALSNLYSYYLNRWWSDDQYMSGRKSKVTAHKCRNNKLLKSLRRQTSTQTFRQQLSFKELRVFYLHRKGIYWEKCPTAAPRDKCLLVSGGDKAGMWLIFQAPLDSRSEAEGLQTHTFWWKMQKGLWSSFHRYYDNKREMAFSVFTTASLHTGKKFLK